MHLLKEDEKKEYMKLDRKQAQEYLKNYEVKEWYADDITRVRAVDIPRADCWCFGFPCQDISLAGNKEGLTNGKRSSLFLRLQNLSEKSKKKINPLTYSLKTLKICLASITESTFSKFSLNWTKSGTMSNGTFSTLPTSSLKTENEYLLSDILEADVPQKYFLSPETVKRLMSYKDKLLIPLPHEAEQITQSERALLKINSRKKISYGFYSNVSERYFGGFLKEKSRCLKANKADTSVATYIYPCITPARINKIQNGRRFKNIGEPMFTLTAQDIHGIAVYNYILRKLKIRKLTPREYFRLQTFPDLKFDLAAVCNSDNQLYKQAGNSVTVLVIKMIVEKMKIE